MIRANKTQKFSDYLKTIGYEELSRNTGVIHLINKHDNSIIQIHNDKAKELVKKKDYKIYPKGFQICGISFRRDFQSKCNVGGFGIGKNHMRAVARIRFF